MGLLDSIKQAFSGRKFEDIGNIEAICPNCGKALESKPTRKKKCPECGKFIYSRTRLSDNQKVLVTESQSHQIDEQWTIVNGSHEEYLSRKKLFEDQKKEMASKSGQMPSDNDVNWVLYTKLNHEAAGKGDWPQYRITRFHTAEILRKENRLETALSFYLEICYLDQNGPMNIEGIDDPEFLKLYQRFSEKRSFLAPFVISRISSIAKKLKLNPKDIESTFKDIAERQYGGLNLPVSPDVPWEKMESEIFKK